MIDPRSMTLKNWCDSVTLDLSTLMQVPRLTSDSDWVRWATVVSSAPEIATYHPPDPRYFNSWRDWASRFVAAVPL